MIMECLFVKKYVENILVKLSMSDCKPMVTPLVVSEKLVKENGEKRADFTLYRSLVGNLLYLTVTRSNIMFASNLLSRFMYNPSQLHLGLTKRMLRHNKETLNYGIKFSKGASTNLCGYCDSDWRGCVDDMKSTSNYYFSLDSRVFYQVSKKQ